METGQKMLKWDWLKFLCKPKPVFLPKKRNWVQHRKSMMNISLKWLKVFIPVNLPEPPINTDEKICIKSQQQKQGIGKRIFEIRKYDSSLSYTNKVPGLLRILTLNAPLNAITFKKNDHSIMH